MKRIVLENNMPVVLKKNENTPRHAVCFYMKINKPESRAGLYTILNRLFLQGTKKRSAEELANVLDENAIECSSEMKCDFVRFKLQCLNEDIELALEVLSDIVKNTTLDDFEKEVLKIKGEIQAEMDEPKAKAMDAFYRNIFKGHFYGNSYSKILEEINELTKREVEDAYNELLNNSQKVFSVSGDFCEENILGLIKKYFADLNSSQDIACEISKPTLAENEVIKVVKEDASQAQIIQGWHVPTIYDKDYAPIMVMNTMLGSCGLSSRLFLELREKKGLAYVVRSSYETYNNAALFNVYIATEPKNIKTSLEGFKIEIDKVKNELVSEQELDNAKNNLLGKRQFFTETNMQQTSLNAYYEDKGLGADYEEQLKELIKAVRPEDIQRVANMCFNGPSLLTVLAPSEYMDF